MISDIEGHPIHCRISLPIDMPNKDRSTPSQKNTDIPDNRVCRRRLQSLPNPRNHHRRISLDDQPILMKNPLGISNTSPSCIQLRLGDRWVMEIKSPGSKKTEPIAMDDIGRTSYLSLTLPSN